MNIIEEIRGEREREEERLSVMNVRKGISTNPVLELECTKQWNWKNGMLH